MYNPELERFDTAIRALWRTLARGQGAMLEGIDVAALQPVVDNLAQTMAYPKSEGQVFRLVRASPLVVPAALELIRRYIEATADDRRAYYQEREELCQLLTA